MKPIVIKSFNPFDSSRDREIKHLDRSLLIKDCVKDIDQTKPFISILNGKPILRKFWDLTLVDDNDILVFLYIPQGGGSGSIDGGGEVKSPILAIIGIGLAIVGTFFTGGLLGAALISVGVGVAAVGLMGVPQTPSAQLGEDSADSSPTLAGSNRIRFGKAIPSIYGRHLIFPDIIVPFAEKTDFTFVLYCIGHGIYTVSDFNIKINGFHYSNYENVEATIINQNNLVSFLDDLEFDVPLISDEVATTLDSAEIYEIGNNITKSNKIVIDYEFPNGLTTQYAVKNSPHTDETRKFDNQVSRIVIVFKEQKPDGTFTDWMTLTDDNSLDGADSLRLLGNTFDFGFNVPDYITTLSRTQTATITFSNSAARQIRIFYIRQTGTYENVSVPSYLNLNTEPALQQPGYPRRYIQNDIVIRKLSFFDTNARDFRFGDLTLLQLKIPNNTLPTGSSPSKLPNNFISRVSCLVQRKLPQLSSNGDISTSLFDSNSITDALLDILIAKYGGKLKPNRIDLEALYDLNILFTQRGDSFNAIYDRKISLWEALRLCARSGRTSVTIQSGQVKIVRDTGGQTPTAMFSMQNIVKGSFKITYLLPKEEDIDGIELSYLNTITLENNEIELTLNVEDNVQSVEVPENPLKVKLFGCNNEAQARREALYLMRNSFFRRRSMTFSTELEGYIPSFGDLVVVSHELPQWGISGEITDFRLVGTVLNANGSVTPAHILIGTSIDLKLEEGKEYRMGFKSLNGTFVGPANVFGKIGDKISVEFFDFNGVLSVDNSRERTQFVFGEPDNFVHRGVVKKIQPRGNYKIDLEVISDDDRIHVD